MLNAKEDTANTYVFINVIPALIPIIFTVTGNSMAVREAPERIISETTHITLISAAAQARNSFVDPIAA
jgi:hypothetical protein